MKNQKKISIEGFDEDHCSTPMTITQDKEFFNRRKTTGDGPAGGVCDLLSKVFE